jgi:uncharacterized protein
MYMDKKYFALKLLPNRSDFVQTMTDDEKMIMQEHIAYWKGFMDQGKVVVFGPVFDPKGAYGLGIVAMDNEEEVREFIKNDPAARINQYEYFPMKAMVP